MKDIKKILEKIDYLPSLPDVVNKVLAIANNPNSTAKDLEEVIKKDPAMTSKILKVANSAYYSFPRQISTISQAVVILGFKSLKNLAISVSTGKLFKSTNNSAFNRKDLWKHSVCVAATAEIIATMYGLSDIEQCFILGLLHDIGLIVEDEFLNKELKNILDAIRKSEDKLLPEEERKMFGIDHAMIGKKLFEKWKFPEFMGKVVGFHHNPKFADDKNKVLTSIVYLADIVVRLKKIGFDGDKYIPALQKQAFLVLNLSKRDIKTISDKLDATFAKLNDFFVLVD